jgi:3-oxoacyl-(acyl-carrier-protein) synthase
VITGIGLIASTGRSRERVWQAVQQGKSGVRSLRKVRGIPEGLWIGAPVDIEPEYPGQLKVITLSQHAAAEAIEDARLDFSRVDLDRFGCAVSGHMGDTGFVPESLGRHDLVEPGVPWWRQWMPNTACSEVANRYRLGGPRICHSTACASGLIDVLAAMRSIQDGQCDIAQAGSVELAITVLALRDGFAPPTVNLTDPDPQCDLDCIPIVGRARPFETALKLSVAFGGHLAAVALRRWPDAEAVLRTHVA